MNQVKKNILLLVFVAFLTSSFGFSQNSILKKEIIDFSIPKNIYFGGERIWIQAGVSTESGSAPSQIIYAELLNRYNESVALTKMPSAHGKAFNYLRIPVNLPSDHYLLRVFTRVSPYLDLEMGLSQQLVTIFNPRVPPAVVANRKEYLIQEDNTDRISLNSKNLRGGEFLELNLSSITTGVKEIQISAMNPFLENQGLLSSKELYQSIESRALVPELFGHIVEAKLDQEFADTTQLYYLSVHGTKSALFTDRSDTSGSMYFDTGGMKNWRFMVVQANNNLSLVDLSIVSPAPKTKFKSEFNFPILKISPADEPYLTALLKAGQVEGYFVHEFDSSPFPVVTGFVEDITYRLDDYTRFESVETVIKEYVPETSVRTAQKNKEFRVLDKVRGSIFDSNPLMLIDAMPVFDSDLLAAFNPKELEKLEVLTRNFYLNEEVFPGVISFSSYKNDFGGFPIPTNGIYLDYQGILPKVLDKQELFATPTDTKMKDWRTVIYWSATDSDKNFNENLRFRLPANSGVYQVKVTFLGQNGNLQQVLRTFRID
jgi:hypothetical protein